MSAPSDILLAGVEDETHQARETLWKEMCERRRQTVNVHALPPPKKGDILDESTAFQKRLSAAFSTRLAFK